MVASDDNYSAFILVNGEKVIVSRTLGKIELFFKPYPNFIRVHRSYLVNFDHVQSYHRDDGGYLIMLDSSRIRVSRSSRDELLMNTKTI